MIDPVISLGATSRCTHNEERLALLLFVAFFSYMFFRNAWVTEDAFINFRVIENFLSGDGFVWNIGERVQVFTSPLWMLLTTGFVAATGEVFYTTIFLSFGLAALTLCNLYFASSRVPAVFLILATILLLTRCFVDYSSSGLETPLVAFTLSAFLVSWCRLTPEASNTFLLVFLGSICAITRHDTLLFTVPFIVSQVVKSAWPLSGRLCVDLAQQVVLGAAPLLAWTAFSLLYYGSAVPNTANAKIVSAGALFDPMGQAVRYLEYMQHFDPIALCLIAVSVFASVIYRSRHCLPLISALVLFVAYVFYVGGDYMAGRFFVAPAVMAAIILADMCSGALARREAAAATKRQVSREISLALICVPLMILAAVDVTPNNRSEYLRLRIVDGIADERGIYYGFTDFLSVVNFGLNHPFRTRGEQIRQAVGSGGGILISCHIGMVGYYGGRELYIIDPLALSDAFLGRMPLRPGAQRIGHFERSLPRDYLESIATGSNRFTHPLVRQYYDDIVEVTRKPLLSADRWGAVLRLNSGYYRELSSVSISDLGGPMLIDGEVSFAMHSCLGGQKVPVYLVGLQTLGRNRLRSFTASADSVSDSTASSKEK